MSKLFNWAAARLFAAFALALPLAAMAATSTYSTYKDDVDTPRDGAYGNAGYQRFQLNATWMFNVSGDDVASTADSVSLDSIKVYWHSSGHGNATIGNGGSNEPDPYLVVTTPQKVIVGISAAGEKWTASGSSTFAFTGLTISPNAQYHYYFATSISGLSVGDVLSGDGVQARFTGTWHGSAKTSDTTVCVMTDGRYSIRCDFAVSEATSTVLTTTSEGVNLATGSNPVFVKGAVADGAVNVASGAAVPTLTVVGQATTLKLADSLSATYLYLPATTTIDASDVTFAMPSGDATTAETVLVSGKISSASNPAVTLPTLADGYAFEPVVYDDTGIKVTVSKPVDATVTLVNGTELLWSNVKPAGWINSAVPTITIDNTSNAGTLVFDENVQAAKIVLPGGWAANIKRSAGVTVDIPYFSCPNNYANHTFTDFEAIPQTVQTTTSADKIYVSGTEALTSFPQISTANQCADISIAQKATFADNGFNVVGSKTININTGADISAARFVLGNNGGVTQTVNQNGGTITVTGSAAPTSNQASILLGHWGSGATATLKTLGGTFTANNVASRLGWDGTATWQIGGGDSAAQVNVYGIVNGGNGHAGAGTLNIMANGTLNLGAGGIDFSNSSNGGNINLAGGAIDTGASAVTIANAKDGGTIINQGTTTAINVGSGETLTVNAVLSGSGVGTLNKTGEGKMILAKTATTKGKLLVSAGTVEFNEGINWGSNGTVEIGQNGTLNVLTSESVAEGELLVAGAFTVNGAVLTNGTAVAFEVRTDGIYIDDPNKITITVPAVANATVTVKIGDDTIGTAAGEYSVPNDSVVTVTYEAAAGYAISGTTEYTINTASATTFDPSESTQVAAAVAYIGTTPYSDLATAFAAVDDDDTLTLVGTAVTLNSDVTVAKSYTLAGDAQGTSVTGSGKIYLTGSAELTLDATLTVGNQFVFQSADAELTFPSDKTPASVRPLSGYTGGTRDNGNGTKTYYMYRFLMLSVGGSNVTFAYAEGATTNGAPVESGTPVVAQQVDEGDILVFTVTPVDGYIDLVVTCNNETLTQVDGKYTVVVGAANVVLQATVTAGPTVAQIGDTEYPSVAAAFAAAVAGDTIKVVANNSLGGLIPVTKNLTLDLNGFTVTGAEGTQMFQPRGGSSFTITDTSEGKTGKAVTAAKVILTGDPCTVTINAGTLQSDDVPIWIWNNQTEGTRAVNINGGKLICGSSTSNSCVMNYSGNINMTGGEIVSTCFGFQGNTVNVSGGIVTVGASRVFYYDDKNQRVTGGTFNMDVSQYVSSGYEILNNGDGTYTVRRDNGWMYAAPGYWDYTGTWTGGAELGDDKVTISDGATYSNRTASAGQLVTVAMTLSFDDVNDDEDGYEGAKAAIRLGTGETEGTYVFQLYTYENSAATWKNATGFTPAVETDYNVLFVLDLTNKTYTASIVSGATTNELSVGGSTTIAFANQNNATPVQQIDFVGSGTVSSVEGSYEDAPVPEGFVENDEVTLSDGTATLTAAQATWLNQFGVKLTVAARLAELSSAQFTAAYLLNLDITGTFSYTFNVTGFGFETVNETECAVVTVTLTREGKVSQAINGTLKLTGAMQLGGQFETKASATISDDDFSEGNTATLKLEKSGALFYKPVIE